MKGLIYILILSVLLGCHKDNMNYTEPLDETEKSFLNSIVSNINKDTVSVFYENMFALSAATINLSTQDAINSTPLYKEMRN